MPCRDILKLVWPLALGMVNNAVMQFADRAFLSRESMASLEASLPASMLSLIVLGFFQSVVAYSGTFAAQYHGAGDERMCRASRVAGLWMAVLAGVATAALIPAGELVLRFAAHGPEVLSRELAYYRVVSAGGVFLLLQMAEASYFTARGRTRLVFAVNIVGNAVNLVLDPLLIFGWCGAPRLGMAGAAYATVFAMFVQWAVLLLFARRSAGAAQPGAKPGEIRRLVLRILRFGVPSGFYSVLNVLSFTVFVFVTGRVGDVAFAVSNACFSVNYLLLAPIEGFALGAATIVGQARGRGDDAAAMRDGLRTAGLGLAFVLALSAAVLLLRHPILSVFAPQQAAAAAEFHSLGSCLFVLMAAWQVFDATDVIMSGALKGAGDTRFVLVWILVAAFGIWLPVVWAVSVLHNTMPALWGTQVFYVAVICIGTLLRWRCGAWRSIRLIGGGASSAAGR